MRIISLLALPLLVLPNTKTTSNIHIQNNETEKILVYSYDDNFSFINEKFEVYGNYSSVDKETLDLILEDKSKFYVFYNLNLDKTKESNLDVLNHDCVIYYYKNNILNTSTLLLNSEDKEDSLSSINNFIEEKYNLFNKKDIRKASSTSTTLFTDLYTGSFREVKKPYGYFDCDYTVLKYRANDVSSLYLINAHAYYVPGFIANKLGDSSYGANYTNESGYIKIRAYNASKDVGYNQIRYGGTPVFKDAYPINNPGKVTINSSYNAGITLGFSFTNGFSEDGLSAETENSIGLNIGYAYSKTYEQVEPRLSAQKDPVYSDKFTWLYSYSDDKGMKETNHLNVGYLFEMNNKNHNLSEGDLAFDIDYLFNTSESGKISGTKVMNYY